jgi:hypothetical protein
LDVWNGPGQMFNRLKKIVVFDGREGVADADNLELNGAEVGFCILRKLLI